jgi:hypothetical protein
MRMVSGNAKQKPSLPKRLLASLLMFSVVFTAAAPLPARADVWGGNILGAMLNRALAAIWEQIEALLVGIAKRVALELARDAANRLVAGGSTKKPAFITDYKEYIYGAALDESMIYMNDLLTNVTGGKNSALNYVIAGGSLQTLGMSYANYLNNEVQAAFARDMCRYNLDQYTNDALGSLQKGDWRVFNAVASVPCNNPLGLTLQIKDATQQRYNQKQETAKARAIAGQGFLGVEVNGKVITPGSIIQGVTEKTNTVVLDLVPNAGKWGELLAAAASTFVNQALNNLYQRGFEEVAKNINRELGKVDKDLLKARRSLQQQLGPGSQFLRNANQQVGGKYTGVQQSVINFNPNPGCSDGAAGGC